VVAPLHGKPESWRLRGVDEALQRIRNPNPLLALRRRRTQGHWGYRRHRIHRTVGRGEAPDLLLLRDHLARRQPAAQRAAEGGGGARAPPGVLGVGREYCTGGVPASHGVVALLPGAQRPRRRLGHPCGQRCGGGLHPGDCARQRHGGALVAREGESEAPRCITCVNHCCRRPALRPWLPLQVLGPSHTSRTDDVSSPCLCARYSLRD
jgi:hypothetical protein